MQKPTVPGSIQAPAGEVDPTLKYLGTVEVGWRTNARSVEVFIRDQGPGLLNITCDGTAGSGSSRVAPASAAVP